ncbi:MAG: hypothetical protein SNJ67_09860 [Chloracidobacterium sp.]|uniref:Uncharacterized protein n=1 Tax=Chloracidobacterium validum TaxID=2821543 RepID=A0ABX8BFH2_9BACT|nr:hypothetical protein [Chloracidobacterium validum]QUW04660.1 hypothetical protein J8C06_12875 [Chloracidobacterium validum]
MNVTNPDASQGCPSLSNLARAFRRLQTVVLWLVTLGVLTLPSRAPAQSTMVADLPSPQALVLRMRESFAQVDDYTCRLVERNFKRTGDFSESAYAFKKPRLIKLVGQAGRSKGAVVILGKDGKPSLRKNGFPVPAFLVRDELRDFAHSDFGSLVDEIARLMLAGEEATVGWHATDYALRLARGNRARTYVIDAKTCLPVTLVEAVDGVRVSLTEWRDLRLNVGLTETDFRP